MDSTLTLRTAFAFGPFQLDPASRRLLRDDATVPLTDRQFTLLHALVGRAGDVLSKDELVQAVWRDVHVHDNNLVQMIRLLRRLLDARDPDRYIQTASRRGYRFAAPVSRLTVRPPEVDLEALLAPERAWIAGSHGACAGAIGLRSAHRAP
jgi:DNA-binding winged helix-turn-helix (wHTH) protein